MQPVLIAGAGPVGLSAALLLARWQVPTMVFEALPEHRRPTGSRALCFQRDVLDIFGRIGCADAMLAEGLTWTTGRTYYREHELFTVRFPSPGPGALPPWINVSQDSVEGYLLDQAEREPLVDLRFGHRVTAVADRGEAVEVTTEATGDGPPHRAVHHGTHLIGADGSRSAVRQLLGIGFDGQSYDDQFLICDLRAELPFPSERRFFFDPSWNPGRQVLVHQCPAGTWRIDWQVPAGFDLETERRTGGLAQRVRQITGSAPHEIVWATSYRFSERVAGAFGAGRAFLTGDAAHVYAPFGARGLNSGLQDAENLAWKLAFVRHGWSPPSLLTTYHYERSAAAAENLRVTSATMDFLVPQTPQRRQWRTEVLERALTDESARRLIDSGKLAEPYWYTASPLTTPNGSLDGFPVEPGAARPPWPGVLCPDGPVAPGGPTARLRTLFGRSLVLLAATSAQAARAAEVARAAVSAPVAAYSLAELDPTGRVGTSLAASARSVHVVRPDGHLAAVLPAGSAEALAAALRRACGW